MSFEFLINNSIIMQLLSRAVNSYLLLNQLKRPIYIQ